MSRRCACPDERIVYTIRRGPNAGDVVCGPCVKAAGGSSLLMAEALQTQFLPIRYPKLVPARVVADAAPVVPVLVVSTPPETVRQPRPTVQPYKPPEAYRPYKPRPTLDGYPYRS